MSNKALVSVVIITKNEEANIEACLKSVYGWAGEIIVVDDESRDRTVELARRYADKILHRKMDIEGKHRNWAYQQAKNDWVLSLDADERVTEELKEEIRKNLKINTKYVCFSIPLRNYIGDYWVKYGGWYPAPKIRLFRKDKFKYEEVEVHPRAFIEGECGRLKSNIIHKGYSTFKDFLNSVNNQSTLEAVKWYKLSLVNPKKASLKMNFIHALWRMFDRFFRRFIRKKGYKDGLYGFIVAYFDSLYQILSYAKYWEMKRESRGGEKLAENKGCVSGQRRGD